CVKSFCRWLVFHQSQFHLHLFLKLRPPKHTPLFLDNPATVIQSQCVCVCVCVCVWVGGGCGVVVGCVWVCVCKCVCVFKTVGVQVDRSNDMLASCLIPTYT